MATRNTANRLDDLEGGVGKYELAIQSIMVQLAKISKQQEEVVSKPDASRLSENDQINSSGGTARGMHPNHDANLFWATKGRKLEIPTFDGIDPDGWILRAERYFVLNKLTPEEQIDVAFISFEGDALRWFQWENKHHPIVSWEILRSLILRQFRSLAAGSLCEQFLALRQEGSIDEYRHRSVELAAPLDGIPEEVFLSQFLNGLEGSIKAEIRLLNPLTLGEAMELAAKVEIRNRVVSKERSNIAVRKNSTTFSDVKSNSPNLSANSGVNVKAASEFRRLSDQEVQQRRALGLCYRCDEKYSPGHRCKKKKKR